MGKQRFVKSAIGLAVAVAISMPPGVQAEGDYVLGTATIGGTNYPVGVALSTLVKIRLEPFSKISLTAINTAGSRENLQLMNEGQIQFAIVQSLYGAWAWEGAGPFNRAYKNLRSVSMLWHNVEHFVVRAPFSTSGTLADISNLYGESFSIGARNSGTEGSGSFILDKLDIDTGKMNIEYLGYDTSANALQNGHIDGMNIASGVPATAVARAYATLGDDIVTLDVSADELARINSEFELWVPYEIPAGTYPNQGQPVNTIAQSNILTVRDDVADEDVYQITKTIYANLPFLNNIHPATKAIALEKAIEGLPLPLHSGAARYYKEQGLDIPARLIAK